MRVDVQACRFGPAPLAATSSVPAWTEGWPCATPGCVTCNVPQSAKTIERGRQLSQPHNEYAGLSRLLKPPACLPAPSAPQPPRPYPWTPSDLRPPRPCSLAVQPTRLICTSQCTTSSSARVRAPSGRSSTCRARMRRAGRTRIMIHAWNGWRAAGATDWWRALPTGRRAGARCRQASYGSCCSTQMTRKCTTGHQYR